MHTAAEIAADGWIVTLSGPRDRARKLARVAAISAATAAIVTTGTLAAVGVLDTHAQAGIPSWYGATAGAMFTDCNGWQALPGPARRSYTGHVLIAARHASGQLAPSDFRRPARGDVDNAVAAISAMCAADAQRATTVAAEYATALRAISSPAAVATVSVTGN